MGTRGSFTSTSTSTSTLSATATSTWPLFVALWWVLLRGWAGRIARSPRYKVLEADVDLGCTRKVSFRGVLLHRSEEGHHGLGVAVGMWWPSSFLLLLLFPGVELDLREVRGDSSAGRLPPAATLRGELDPPTVGNEGRWGVVPPVGPVPLKGFPPCRPGRLAAPEVLRLRSGRRGAADHRAVSASLSR